MNKRRSQQLATIAGPILVQGEQIRCTTMANVGSVSAKRKLLTTALVGVLSAGTVIAVVQPRPMYCVLTDQRILYFDGKTSTGKPGKLLMSLPLALVTATPPAKALLGLGFKIELTVQGEEKGVKMVFPPAAKSDGRRFARRLPAANADPVPA
jgi:hypothetical protein